MTQDLASLVAAVEKIKKAHSDAWPDPFVKHEEWRARVNAANGAAITALRALGAHVKDDWREVALKLGGRRSTSTSGVGGAMSNWLTAARKRLEEQAT